MKRKSFFKKLVACITAIVMALSLAPISAFAAIEDYPPESSLPEVIKNGNLSKLTEAEPIIHESWTYWGTYAVAEGSATFNNVGTAANDYTFGLKQALTGMTVNSLYRVTYTVKSSIGRWIKSGYDRNASTMNFAWVNANEETTVTYTYTAPAATGNFAIFLGQPASTTTPAAVDDVRGTHFADEVVNFNQSHSVTITNVSIKRAYTDKDKWCMEDGEPSQGVPKNLIKNGNFAEKEEIVLAGSNTTNFGYTTNANTSIYWNRYRVVFGITTTGADYQQRIRATYTRPAAGTYTIGATIKSSIDRKVIFGAAGDAREIALDLEAGKKQTVYYTQSLTAGTTTNGYNLYLGGNNTTVPGGPVPTYGKHDIEIYDVFVLRNDNGVALQALVDSYAGVTTQGNYTTRSWNAFVAARQAAKDLLPVSTTSANQVDLNRAEGALEKAYNGLGVQGNSAALQALYNANETKVETDYTATTWAVFKKALDSAKLYLDEGATQAELDDAGTALTTAVAGLKPDKTALASLYDENAERVGTPYTSASWSTFNTARQNAETVLGNDNATLTNVKDALTSLQNAVAGLKPDKTALAALIAASDLLVQNQYTSAAWTPFASALSSAKSVNNDANATVAQVADSLSALQSAKDGLRFDKSALLALIDTVINLTKDTANGSYTYSSWNTFKSARTTAQGVNSNAAATWTEISEATTALQTAYTDLKLVDKSALLALYNTWKDVEQGNYTKSTWDTLLAKREAAKGVLENDDALQAAVTSALNELQSATGGMISTNKADLKALYNPWKDTVQGLLTDSSWAKLKAALSSTKAVLENGDALQADVEVELTALTAALGSLEYRMPTDVKVSKASATSVKVSWTKADDVDGYEVWYATSENGTYNKVASTTETSLTHTGLKIGGTYYYKVLAYKTVDQKTSKSDLTSVVSIKLPIPVPTGVKAVSAGAASINVTWNKVNGVTGYAVYRAASLNGAYSKVATVASGKTSYTNNGLTSGKTYYYKVTAINKIDVTNHESSYSSAVKFKAALVKPAIKVKAGKVSIKLSWKKVAGATKYEIYRATRSNGKYKKVATVSKKVTYTNKKLKKSTKYYYKVKATQKVGKKTYRSAFSAKKSAKAK